MRIWSMLTQYRCSDSFVNVISTYNTLKFDKNSRDQTLPRIDSSRPWSNTHSKACTRGGHCIGDCTPTRDRSQSEVKRPRRNFETGQVVKLGIRGSLRTVKVSPGDRWAWLMLDSQGSRPDFRCSQGVKHENLLGQDLDRGRRWKYRRLCSVPPLM